MQQYMLGALVFEPFPLLLRNFESGPFCVIQFGRDSKEHIC